MVINEYAAVLKQVKPINFLFFRTETTAGELEKLTSIANELFQEAFENNLRITGPVHWHYFGFSDNDKMSFTLEIALPVSDVIGEYDGKFHFKRSEPFKCVSITHEGSWSEFPKTYAKLMHFLTRKKLTPSGMNREIYINADFANPDANITEVQLGIK